MTPERWHQIEEVLQAALDRPLPERTAFIDQACAGDAALLTETTSLVEAYSAADEFFEKPAMARDAQVILGDHSLDQVGREIGPYKIIERLGIGGMGEVYLAQDSRLDRLVALKVLPPYFVSDETRLRRFQREARAVSALNHPNILTIHEVGELDGVHFIATEFIDGRTIRDMILAGDLSLLEILDITGQVAGALSVAHSAGIVHRDIKPENIMRRVDGIVKVLDFGIAKLLEERPDNLSTVTRTQTGIGAVLGTVGYMSPEQARGLEVDERTDIWSLGVVLYEMIALRAPFIGATPMDTIVAILEREPAALTGSTDDLAKRVLTIVEQALRKDSGKRYQTAAEVISELTLVRQEIDQVELSRQTAILESMRSSEPLEQQDLAGVSSNETTLILNKPNPQRRYWWMAGFGLLVFILSAAFLYQKFVRPRRVAGVTAGSETATPNKLYREMNEAEQMHFIDQQEQHISAMMGERQVKLNAEALRAIKGRVDWYVGRLGKTTDKPGEGDLNVVYWRAVPLVPMISQVFAARKIPPVIAIYLPMIESAYRPCYENPIGAKGLFQFLPTTAKAYGVEPGEMCDVEKMTPAAAHYIADRMAELGEDSQSMTLVLLSYNRGVEGVLNPLRKLRGTDNYERNFWTLYAHRDQMDEQFRNEGAGYVPAFFAAAIVGENPGVFGLSTPVLSSLAGQPVR